MVTIKEKAIFHFSNLKYLSLMVVFPKALNI